MGFSHVIGAASRVTTLRYRLSFSLWIESSPAATINASARQEQLFIYFGFDVCIWCASRCEWILGRLGHGLGGEPS